MRATGRAVLAVFALAPALAGASQRGTAIAVDLDKRVAGEASTISYVLREVARQGTRVDYYDLAEIAEGPAAQKRAADAEEARRALQAGKSAYQNLEFDQAITELERAIELFQTVDLSVHMPGMLAAHALLGATQYFSGDVRSARDHLGRLLALKTDYVFDREVFSPDVLGLAEEVRAEIQTDHEYTLEIQVAPVRARVYVDGVFRGMSPQELKDLAAGEHYVTVIAPGYAMLQETRRAGPGAMAKLSLKPAAGGPTLLGNLNALRRGLEAGNASNAAAVLARWAGVDEVLVAGVIRTSGQTVKLVAARVASDGHVLAKGEHEASMNDATALSNIAAFAGQLYRSDLPRGPNGAPVAASLKVSKPLGRSTWGYIGLGVGAGALAAGTLFALQARKGAADAKDIPQVDQEGISSAVSSARTQAIVADSLFVASAAAVGVGLFLVMPRGDGSGPARTTDDVFAVAPWVAPDGAGLVVSGRF